MALAVPLGSRMKNIPGPGFSVGEALVSLRFVVRVRIIVLLARNCSTKRCLILLHGEGEIPTVIKHDVNRERKILEVTISCFQSWWDFLSHLSEPSAEHINSL